MQFYLLSVITNLLSGVILSGDYLANYFPGLKLILPTLEQRATRLTIGVITALVGFVKLFVSIDQTFVGDLLPGITGMVVGGAIALAVLRPDSDTDQREQSETRKQIYPTEEESSLNLGVDGPVEQVARAAIRRRIPLGLVGISVALLHFLFPKATFF